MKLAECNGGDVVQNVGNRNYYRFERPEGERARIRPLELFPTGLLVAKPVDTIVEAGLVVRLVGGWAEALYVEVLPGDCKSRKTLERERERKLVELQELRAAAVGLTGGRLGSHANKVKAVADRLAVLNQGLAEPPRGARARGSSAAPAPGPLMAFDPGALVQLPSGAAAVFLGAVRGRLDQLAGVRAKGGASFVVDPSVLRPLSERWVSTV